MQEQAGGHHREQVNDSLHLEPPKGWKPPPRYRRARRFKPDARFWKLRAEGTTQAELARLYGVNPSTICRFLAPIEAKLRGEA
jgi:hypothetical protein